MRILTVRQPWAWAIIHGGKNVENRSRNIAGTYRGTVAIHVGLKPDVQAMRSYMRLPEGERDWWPGVETAWNKDFGLIIGVVDLVDVHHSSECFRECEISEGMDGWQCSQWARSTGFHLVFENPRPLPHPILYMGGQGLRWVRFPSVVEEINEQLGVAS